MKTAIPSTETLTREERILILADNMMSKAADLHRAAMALKSEIKDVTAEFKVNQTVARRNSKIKIVPQGR